jgi:hypothetical protein
VNQAVGVQCNFLRDWHAVAALFEVLQVLHERKAACPVDRHVWTGSLARGKLAELALIDGDPSKHIGDLRQVELVMRDGKMMDAQALRASLSISGPPKR